MNIVLNNIHVISPEDGLDDVLNISIRGGKIGDIGKRIKEPKSSEILNMKGKTAVPGFFDMHVHFREPGQTHKENLATGCVAAANGGITGVLCMPNTAPPVDNPVLLRELAARTEGMICDVKFSACATKGREGKELSPVLSLAEAGALGITDDGSPVSDPEILRRVFEYTSQCGLPFIQHCEDMLLSNKGVMNEGLASALTGLRGIPSVSETSVIARDIEICSYVRGSRYHVQHISCKGSVELLRSAKARGVSVTGEACPHHFILSDKYCTEFDTNFKMNPPLRTHEDTDAVIEGLSDGTIEVICTDHAPHTDYEKSQGFNDAPFGIIGLETMFGLSFTYLVAKGFLTMEQLIQKCSVNPRRLLGLPSVRLIPGEEANISVFDTNAKWTVNSRKFMSRSRNTPFNGYRLQGKPVMIINNGKEFISTI